ncbi:hypothetical protein OH76DRAFT_985365 [Lentinus brumalis]|uniref:Uncharacterized protein n=1 Tax=Lentinus brumalis TaxID=2498619 RepID=A0A371DQ72_9APHY|nr:hypothetical protein OH76DRAFT_985365 [Polyporus brumalis]
MSSSSLVDYYTSTATYGSAEVAGVAMLVVAGAISLAAVVPVLAIMRWFGPKLANTRIMPFFVSLLLANVLQAIGTLINSRWVHERSAVPGSLCSAQGGIKQAGNVGMALWSFVLSLHVFMLLFVRRVTLSALHSWLLLGAGWFLVALVVVIGPTAIQTADRGPYFGPTGYWCWITQNYPHEQFLLEYFFEFLSAILSFCLYTAVLLRVRGNLVKTSGKWHLRFVPHGERWRLAIRRDVVDGSMMQVATRMVWYPVAYTILLLPVTIARFVAFSGHEVPFRATIFADFVFNLQGVVNVALLLATRRFVPDTATLPLFEPRKRVSMSSPEAKFGITPFVLPPRGADAAEKGVAAETEEKDQGKGEELPRYPAAAYTTGVPGLSRTDSMSSASSTHSADSQTPLVLPIR